MDVSVAASCMLRCMHDFYFNPDSFQPEALLHVHIPKTAGVSFYQQFKKRLKSFHADHRDVIGSIRRDVPKSAGCRFYTGHFRLMDIIDILPVDNVLVLAPLRSPVERLISHYNYNSSPSHTWHEDFRRNHPTFEKFLANPQFSQNAAYQQLLAGVYVDGASFLSSGGKRFRIVASTPSFLNPLVSKSLDLMGFADFDGLERKNALERTHQLVSVSDLVPSVRAKMLQSNMEDYLLYSAVKEFEETVYSK